MGASSSNCRRSPSVSTQEEQRRQSASPPRWRMSSDRRGRAGVMDKHVDGRIKFKKISKRSWVKSRKKGPPSSSHQSELDENGFPSPHHEETFPRPPSPPAPDADVLSTSRHPSDPPLYDYAEGGEWPLLLSRCQTHPSECGYSDGFGNNPLHLACRRTPPVDVVRAISDAEPRTLLARTEDGLTPLHFACYCGASAVVVSFLARREPKAVLMPDRLGRTPLHLVAAGLRTRDRHLVLKSLLDVADVAVVARVDSKGRTALSLLLEDYAEDIEERVVMAEIIRERLEGEATGASVPLLKSDDKRQCDPAEIMEGWRSMVLLLNASYLYWRGEDVFDNAGVAEEDDDIVTIQLNISDSTESGDNDTTGPWDEDNGECDNEGELEHVKIVHAAVGVPGIPPPFVRFVIDLFPKLVASRDGRGDLPLHAAVAAPTSISRVFDQDSSRSYAVLRDPEAFDQAHTATDGAARSDRSIIIRELLSVYPAGANKRGATARLPLHLAIELGRSWDDGGVRDLAEATLFSDGLGEEAQIMGRDDEEELQRSILRALCTYNPFLNRAMTSAHTDNSFQVGKRHQDAVGAPTECGNVQVEAVRTLSKLLPWWGDRTALGEELVSRSLVIDRSALSHVNAKKRARDLSTRAAMLHALNAVLRSYRDSGAAAEDEHVMELSLDVGKKTIFHRERCIREAAASVLGTACDFMGYAVAGDVLQEVILADSDGTVGFVESEDDEDEDGGGGGGGDGAAAIAADHGRACALYCIFIAPVGSQIDDGLVACVISLLRKRLVRNRSSVEVCEAAWMACGAVLASSGGKPGSSSERFLKHLKTQIIKSMRPGESTRVHLALGRGLCIAAKANRNMFVTAKGQPGTAILDATLTFINGTGLSADVKSVYLDFLKTTGYIDFTDMNQQEP